MKVLIYDHNDILHTISAVRAIVEDKEGNFSIRTNWTIDQGIPPFKYPKDIKSISIVPEVNITRKLIGRRRAS